MDGVEYGNDASELTSAEHHETQLDHSLKNLSLSHASSAVSDGEAKKEVTTPFAHFAKNLAPTHTQLSGRQLQQQSSSPIIENPLKNCVIKLVISEADQQLLAHIQKDVSVLAELLQVLSNSYSSISRS
jgi:hypothetical protein